MNHRLGVTEFMRTRSVLRTSRQFKTLKKIVLLRSDSSGDLGRGLSNILAAGVCKESKEWSLLKNDEHWRSILAGRGG